jgi:adenosyl cobinamide kinase/adenosyl cobinamide phosphate guanylyltransferase
MDVALTIHELVPRAKYFGSVTANSKEAFDKIRWHDERKKPTWSELEAKWVELEPTLKQKEDEEVLIQAKIREMAIKSLQGEGKLPENII